MLAESFMRDDLSHNYDEWINRGLRKIQQDEDWTPMRVRPVLTIGMGESSVPLPDNFKSLTSEQNPVTVRRPGETESFPCEITSFERTKRLRATTFFPPLTTTQYAARSGVPVYLEPAGELMLLCVTAPAAETLEFLVSMYAFVPDLVNDLDENFLTRRYPTLVENAIKAIAFSRINELDTAAAFESAYRNPLLKEAKIDDFRRQRQGRPMRMGG